MSAKFQSIGLVGNTADQSVVDTLEVLGPYLKKRGASPLLLALDKREIKGCEMVSANDLADRADLVMSVGGDGTMLYATHLAAPKDTPLLGINRGRLGFLADISPDEMTDRIDEVLAGEYVSETRSMLVAKIDGENAASGYALNDVVLQRAGDMRLLDIETYVNGVYLNTHGSDGLIIATPTGSTAYALSCGGPILEPSLDAIVVVPICPHTLSDRPIVIDGNSKVEVRLIDRKGVTGQISCDGKPIADVNPGGMLDIEKSPFVATLLHPKGYDYFRILRSKLAWGHDSRRSR
ncbi:MAG: NAD(+) kinase [Gammaproteobacteria bacterium]|nr:NAD(+) kinase [Gammaproteobacteria bacterium]MDH3767332.1 NAD(+) kinase [Gammaproteobacteria bacterium]